MYLLWTLQVSPHPCQSELMSNEPMCEYKYDVIYKKIIVPKPLFKLNKKKIEK